MFNDWFSIGSFTIHGYGVMIGLGFVAALILGMFRSKKRGLPKDTMPDLVLLCIICGFLGGKLLHIIVELFTHFDRFREDFWGRLWIEMGSSGFVIYGGIILCLLAALVYCKRKKLSFLVCFDMVAPTVILAQGFGRLGCFCAGCCYGKVTDSWFAIRFPEGSFAPPDVPLIPVQLISAVGCLLIALFLMWLDRKPHKTGFLGGMYMLMYGIGRFVIEFFRDDHRGAVGPLSTSQFISLGFILVAVILFVRKERKPVAVEGAEAAEAEDAPEAEETDSDSGSEDESAESEEKTEE